MLNKLFIKLFLPIVVLMIALGALYYFLVLRTVEDFAQQNIEKDLENLTHDLFNVVDHEFMQAIKSGKADDRVAFRISQVDTLDILERKTGAGNFQLIIIEHTSGTVRLATDLAKQLNLYEIIQLLQAGKKGDLAKIAGEEFYVRQFYFSPWDWSFLILKNTQTYSELSQKVHQVYQTSTFVLIAVTLLLVFYLFRSIKVPIDSIVSSVSQGKSPEYKGTYEFEFLSQSIAEMMVSLKNVAAERKRAEKKAELASQAKSDFLANMSHELRTPLNAILGFAQIMERGKRDSSDKESLSIIRRSGSHLLTLINQVLDLSKIEAGYITLEKNCFDLFCFFDELEDMLLLKAGKKGLAFTFAVHQDVPRYICTDEVKLRQVLINLISNAIKFTKEGFVILRVSLQDSSFVSRPLKKENYRPSAFSDTDHRLRFEIEDSGVGIAPEEVEQLFQAFGQISRSRQVEEGTGLGLVISKKFVDLLGGEIFLESKVGEGATFSFTIPVQEVSENPTLPIPPSARAVGMESGQPCYRMLIVDDKWDNRKFLFRLLDSYGFELREATSGQEALDVQEAWEPDLIWMDIRMPGIDGLEATKRIRAKKSHTKQPVIIAVTAGVVQHTAEMLLREGCNDIVIKPFDDTDLVGMLQRHLNVKFIYKEVEKALETIDLQAEKLRMSPSDFDALPQEIVLRLKKSIAALKMDATLNVIAEIRALNEPLADTLKKLVIEYRFDTLQELLDQVE